jgi:hypothetical protein
LLEPAKREESATAKPTGDKLGPVTKKLSLPIQINEAARVSRSILISAADIGQWL